MDQEGHTAYGVDQINGRIVIKVMLINVAYHADIEIFCSASIRLTTTGDNACWMTYLLQYRVREKLRQ